MKKFASPEKAVLETILGWSEEIEKEVGSRYLKFLVYGWGF
jgi:hypothetical protein